MNLHAHQTPDERDHAAAIIAVVAATTDPLGCTSDELADALNLAHAGHALQDALEGLVARNLLARQGIGHGALYTLPTPPTGHP